ncbi:antibiotic biosynthesis monooxygenase family protein [Stackebrandtia soli]|uniref:antibiotic biosynthesis monooxygenase family protein n=1 Tax=Stackebrandtia soli TaxID=1892856 RepID=UPI0039ED1B3C
MTDMIARMWEVKGHAERIGELVAWTDGALSGIETSPGCLGAQLFRSEDRVVVITTWRDRDAAVDLPEPAPELIARPPHAWDFTPVERH